jgi:catechol 2,3-dioxygenase-like lactoylglutathione lyase family enzyme
MIKNVRHTGIVVHDLEKMAEFYRLLGFVDENRAVEEGPFIEQVVDLVGVKVEWIKMRSPDGCLLELLQYHTHPQKVGTEMAKANDLGCSHLAFTVDVIERTCEEIVRAGGSVGNPPATTPNGRVKVAYCHDPEGVLIEIVEEI